MDVVSWTFCRYRRANEGKFPTSSATHKQVGGSYYVVRNILQELESQSKASPSNIENEYSMGKELIQENESLPKAGTRNNGHSEAIDNVETISTRDEHLYADGELQTVTWAEKTLSEGVAKCPIAVSIYSIDCSVSCNFVVEINERKLY